MFNFCNTSVPLVLNDDDRPAAIPKVGGQSLTSNSSSDPCKKLTPTHHAAATHYGIMLKCRLKDYTYHVNVD